MENDRLIYLGQSASGQFWDTVWAEEGISKQFLADARETQWSKVTRNYLQPTDGPILEGGCGRGQHVAALHKLGYQAIGVDFAERTIAALNTIAPELDFRLGDVRQLDFESDYFAGYWSLGVIEHFWDGYLAIANEMWRVLKNGGYLFLAFPYMNPLRRLKARMQIYPRWQGGSYGNFYQFALEPASVRSDFERLGFELVSSTPVLGRQGVEEELPRFWGLLSQLYDYEGRNILVRSARRIVHEVYRSLLPLSGYSLLMVLRKPG